MKKQILKHNSKEDKAQKLVRGGLCISSYLGTEKSKNYYNKQLIDNLLLIKKI